MFLLTINLWCEFAHYEWFAALETIPLPFNQLLFKHGPILLLLVGIVAVVLQGNVFQTGRLDSFTTRESCFWVCIGDVLGVPFVWDGNAIVSAANYPFCWHFGVWETILGFARAANIATCKMV